MSGGDLGKRKRWDDGDGMHAGLGAIKKKKVYVPVREHPDVNFLGLLIGPRGSTQKQLQEMSGAKILIRGKGSQRDPVPGHVGHPDDDDELHVSIEGTEEAVEKALKEVEQILFNPEQAMRLKQEQLSNLEKIKNSDGFNGASSSSTALVTYGDGGDEYQIEMRVPNGVVGLIIGKGGENTKRIQAQSGAHMQIAKESDMKPGETHRSIVVKGHPDAVAECKRMVDEIVTNRLNPRGFNGGGAGGGSGIMQQLQQYQSNGTRELDTPFVMKVPVPDDKIGIIIGKGGLTIKAIQEKTRTQIQVPKGPDEENSSVRTLSIGAETKEDLEQAQLEIQAVLQQHELSKAQNSTMPAEPLYISVPDDKVGVIIGKGGCTIKDIQTRTRTRVQVPPSADLGSIPPVRTVCIQGTVEGQHAARYEIEMVLQNHAMGLPTGQNAVYGAGGGGYGQGGGGQYQQWGAQQQQQQQQQQAGYYGAGGYMQQQQSAYGAQAYASGYAGYSADPAAAASAMAGAAADPSAVPTDPTAYYNDFWLYASYYGEAAARLYYNQWSPPEGTPPPPGIVLPTEAAAAATLGGAVDAATGAANGAAAATAAAVPSSSNGAAAEHAAAGGAAAATAAQGAGNAAAPDAEAAVSEEAAAAEWEAYRRTYKEWYEAHGKAIGADPEPPEPA